MISKPSSDGEETRRIEKKARIEDPRSPEIPPSGAIAGQTYGHADAPARAEVTEEELERALVHAVLAPGDNRALVETLRAALERRQRARAGNVVPLGGRRSKDR